MVKNSNEGWRQMKKRKEKEKREGHELERSLG